MACLFCDQTPETRDAVKTLREIAGLMKDLFWGDDSPSVATRVHEMYRMLQRVTRDRDMLKDELVRRQQVIQELQNTISEWQHLGGRGESYAVESSLYGFPQRITSSSASFGGVPSIELSRAAEVDVLSVGVNTP
jgi:hypothetical protein